MSITAEKVSKISSKSKEIERVIKEQLATIDDRIMTVDKQWGRNIIEYQLPTFFPSLNHLEKKDAQRIVYSSILISLDSRKFETKILFDTVDSVSKGPTEIAALYIAWNVAVDEEEKAAIEKATKG